MLRLTVFKGGLLAVCLLAGSQQVQANPWIEADDVYLRGSIQQLADAGYLQGHVHTYPLMWSGIARDLRRIDVSLLNDNQQHAYYRLSAALNFAQQEAVSGVRASLSSDREAQRSFADTQREYGALRASRTVVREGRAARLQTTLRAGSEDSNSYVFHGSYLATTLGNWAVSVDQMPLWWGPGQDQALVLSSNARPAQALRINRLQDDAFDVPVLSWAGHWHATAFFGRTQSAGPLGDQEIGGARVSVRPFSPVQFGASYTLQSGDSLGERNQLLGLDARVALPGALALYAEVTERQGASRVSTSLAHTLGIDYYLPFGRHFRQLFLEYSDIPANFYDDDIDPAGYRRWQRSMGAGADQDVESYALGYRMQRGDGTGWRVTLRDQTMGSSNGLALLQYEERLAGAASFSLQRRQLDIQHQRPFGETLLTLGLIYSYDKLDEYATDNAVRGGSEQDIAVQASWEFRF